MSVTVKATVWIEDLGKGDLCSPFFNDLDNTLHVILQKSGEILSVNSFGQTRPVYSTGGQPSSAVFDHENSRLLVADFAHGAVLALTFDGGQETVVAVYEDNPLKGPNSLLLTPNGIFFSDSGAMGETGLHSPTGSLFAITSSRTQSSLLKPVSLNTLASPTGLALSPCGKFIFLAEMMTNRIIRYFQQPEGVYHGSVWYQISGGVGPVALAVDQQGSLYVALYDECSVGVGRVLVINAQGVHVSTITTMGSELSGLVIRGNILYITERSRGAVYQVTL